LLLALVQWFTLQRSDRTESGSRKASLASKISLGLVIAIIAQAFVGVAQARLGVPAQLVLVHMLLASLLISLITFNYLASRAK
jgi:heme A synthase